MEQLVNTTQSIPSIVLLLISFMIGGLPFFIISLAKSSNIIKAKNRIGQLVLLALLFLTPLLSVFVGQVVASIFCGESVSFSIRNVIQRFIIICALDEYSLVKNSDIDFIEYTAAFEGDSRYEAAGFYLKNHPLQQLV